jgi:hypothetical protein
VPLKISKVTIPTDASVTLVIFGAGASYDCQPDDVPGNAAVEWRHGSDLFANVRPPLTQQLVTGNRFSNSFLNRHNQARPLVAHLRDVMRESPGNPTPSLETALGEYESRAAHDSSYQSHLMAFRLYLRDYLYECSLAMQSHELSGANNYHKLLNQLRWWAIQKSAHVALVSFNYDLLVDLACRDEWRLGLWEPTSYTENPHMSLVKPHGSVHWSWVFDRPEMRLVDRTTQANAAMDLLPDLSATPRTVLASEAVFAEVPTSASVKGVLVPAMALPIQNKAAFAWPSTHQSFFEGLKGRVNRVVTVGWRAAEAHFVELLARLTTDDATGLVVTGGPQAASEGDQIAERISLAVRQAWTFPRGFRGVIQENVLGSTVLKG